MSPALLPNFSWVLPGVLAAGGMPARNEPDDEVAAYLALHERGVRVVACLLETPPPRAAIVAAGLVPLHFPIGDYGTPRDVAAFGAFVDEVHARIVEGRPAFVHCWAGVGRAGMFAATYLARHGGVAGDAAIAEVRRLRPGSVQTSAQAQIVHQLAGRR